MLPDRTGKTDAEGYLTETIPPNATGGEILLGSGLDIESYPIRLGYIAPLDAVQGIQARLNNLNYSCGFEDGNLTESTRDALRRFQRDHGLEITGEPDDLTRMKLEELHVS